MKTNKGFIWFTGVAGVCAAVCMAPRLAAAPASGYAEEKEVAAVVKIRPAKDPEVEAKYQWNLKTLVGDYDAIGSRNAAWDGAARKALEGFARLRSNQDSVPPGLAEEVAAAVTKAVEAGCDDPMIRYLHIRLVSRVQEGMTDRRFLELMREADRAMRESSYHGLRKFYAAFRRFAQLGIVDRSNNSAGEANSLIAASSNHLHRALQDRTIPTAEIYEAWTTVREDARSKYFENLIGQLVLRNMAALGRTGAVVPLIKGQALIQMAWTERGGDVADKVTAAGWKGFAGNLAKAAEELNLAWRMDPSDVRIPTTMIRVEMGQGLGRERMELWFSRAMELDTNNTAACRAKLLYLEPKWFGDAEAMLAFGRECVRSTRWGGEVPLTLVRAHENLAKYLPAAADREGYWKRPGVWPDVKSAYEKMLAMNPQGGWRHNYALMAYRSAQWDDFNKQVPLLGTINYAVFGGKAEWEKMLAQAKSAAGK